MFFTCWHLSQYLLACSQFLNIVATYLSSIFPSQCEWDSVDNVSWKLSPAIMWNFLNFWDSLVVVFSWISCHVDLLPWNSCCTKNFSISSISLHLFVLFVNSNLLDYIPLDFSWTVAKHIVKLGIGLNFPLRFLNLVCFNFPVPMRLGFCPV